MFFILLKKYMKKSLVTKIFLGIAIFVLVIFGIEIFSEYLQNHTYYYKMLESRKHWKMIIRCIVSAFIPLAYLIWHKKFSLRNFLIYLLIGLLWFS